MLQIKEKITISLNKLEKSLGMKAPNVAVLNYHSISNSGTIVDVKPIEFAKHISLLKSNFDFISLDQVVDYLQGKRQITKPSIALTFDDGYQDILNGVMPTLKKNSIPATFFVLSQPKERNIKELENNKRLLTAAQIKKLYNDGWGIGCHSATHTNLRLKGTNLKREIADSKEKLENIIGSRVKYFAYPKGKYNDEVLTHVENAGYEACFSLGFGAISAKTNKYLIPRIPIDRTHTLGQIEAFLTNWARLYLAIKQRIL